MSTRIRAKNVGDEHCYSIIDCCEKISDVMKTVSTVSLEDGEPSDLFRLKYFKASLYASVLEDTISQIRILGELNNELRITKTLAHIVQLRANKYQVSQPAVSDELGGINPKTLGKEEYKLDKLANDRKYVIDSLLTNYLDLSLNRSYRALVECNRAVTDKDKHRAFLLEDEAKNRLSRRELARQLRQQRNHIKSAHYDYDRIIDDLRTQVEDAALNAEVRSRYVANWQGARTEQHIQAIRVKESGPLDNIELYKQQTDHEQRVHQEIELIINIAINEKLEQVESLMNKYDKDIEAMDLKIQIMKNDHTNKLEYRAQLEELYAEHDRLMKNWQNFKAEREKARVYVEKMHNAAAVVQAWWRGLLVRMALGPYKPAKRPPPKDKKKKK